MVLSLKQKIQEIEKLNQLLAENLVDAIWIIDAQSLRYEYITDSISRISGYTPRELVDTTILERLTPESARNVTKVLAAQLKAYESGRRAAHSLDLELRHKNGDTYWIEIRAKFIKEPNSPLKIVGVTRDITAKKKAQLEQQALAMELAAALKEKEALLKEVKILRGLLPICSACKRIRDDNNRWWPLDAYVKAHSDADFTHTICPDCVDVLYDDI